MQQPIASVTIKGDSYHVTPASSQTVSSGMLTATPRKLPMHLKHTVPLHSPLSADLIPPCQTVPRECSPCSASVHVHKDGENVDSESWGGNVGLSWDADQVHFWIRLVRTRSYPTGPLAVSPIPKITSELKTLLYRKKKGFRSETGRSWGRCSTN